MLRAGYPVRSILSEGLVFDSNEDAERERLCVRVIRVLGTPLDA